MRPTFRRLAAWGGSMSLLLGIAHIGAAEAAPPLDCGSVITGNTTLNRDIGPCPGDGIVVGADNITLNLNGHQIFGTPGPGDGTHAGIRLPFRTGVSVVGRRDRATPAGTVRDFDAGVFVNGGSGNSVRSLLVRDNIGPLDSNSLLGDGIVLFHSAGNDIRGNVVRHNGRFDGIGVLGLGSDDNIIQDNTVGDNVGTPEGATEVRPGEIPHHINAPGHGIIVSHFLDQPIGSNQAIYRNNLMNNTVRRNDGSGISTVANFDAVISGNLVEGNAPQYYRRFDRLYEPFPPSSVVGIGVSSSDGLMTLGVPTNVLVKNNVVNRNGLVGIHVLTAGNKVVHNQVFDNGAFGISVDSVATPNLILNNRTGGNYLVDLADQTNAGIDCSGNRWWGNTYSSEVQPLGREFGLVAPYYPDCTADGPNKKGPRGRPAGANRVPSAASDQEPSGSRGRSDS